AMPRSSILGSSLGLVGTLLFSGRGRVAQDDLVPLADQAKSSFTPITPEQVAEARQQLEQVVADFERFLVPGSRKSNGWQSYLEWEGLKQALANEDRPDFEAMRVTLSRLGLGRE